MSPSSHLSALLVLCIAWATLAAQDFGTRNVALFETEEWSFSDSSVSGEAFWHFGTVVFTHQATGDTHTTTTFYDGGSTWRFRFFADRKGTWTFQTTGSDPDQAGHSGTIEVGDVAMPGKHGPYLPLRDHWVVQEADGGFRQGYLHVFQHGASYVNNDELRGLRVSDYNNHFADDQAKLDLHMDKAEAHGMTGLFFYMDRWLGGDGLPGLDGFRMFEWILAEAWKRNMHVQIWMWGDSESHGDKTFREDLHRYMAARVGAVGSWSADKGWDTAGPDDDIALAPIASSHADHILWADNLRRQFAWEKAISVRTNAHRYFGYVSNDIRKKQLFGESDLGGYPHADSDPYRMTRWMREDLPHGQPHFHMRRNWIGRDGWDGDNTLHAIWGMMMGGGAACDWGIGESTFGYTEYPDKGRYVVARDFFQNGRLRLDLEPVDGRSSAWVLGNAVLSHVLLYQRGVNSITVDLSGAPAGLPIVAVDTESTTYTELDRGTASSGSTTISLPSTSNWAVAIGDFSQTHRSRRIDAGKDRLIVDSDGNGSAGVDLRAIADPGITGVAWTWDGGSASGASVRADLALGYHAITCTGTNPDGADATDTIYVWVVGAKPSGALPLVGRTTVFEVEGMAIDNSFNSEREWTVFNGSSRNETPTRGAQGLDAGSTQKTDQSWNAANRASLTLGVPLSATYEVWTRGSGHDSGGAMWGLNGSKGGDVKQLDNSHWRWYYSGSIAIPVGEQVFELRAARDGQLDAVALCLPGHPPMSNLGPEVRVAEPEDGPGGDGEPNTDPVISSVGATPATVTGTTTQLTVTADDADGDSLSYVWQATSAPNGASPQIGSGADPAVTFDTAGSYVFTVAVSDGKGGSTGATVDVLVEQTAKALSLEP